MQMLYTVVKQNSYQDSINLMLLTNKINAMPGVVQSQIMMGTDANKDIYDAAGLLTPEAAAANPSDMVIVVEADDEKIVDEVLSETEAFLDDLSVKKAADGGNTTATSWEEAVAALPMPTWLSSPSPASMPRPSLSAHSTWASTCSPLPITSRWRTRFV